MKVVILDIGVVYVKAKIIRSRAQTLESRYRLSSLV